MIVWNFRKVLDVGGGAVVNPHPPQNPDRTFRGQLERRLYMAVDSVEIHDDS